MQSLALYIGEIQILAVRIGDADDRAECAYAHLETGTRSTRTEHVSSCVT